MEGIIKKIDKRKRRAKICLSFMGMDKMVNVGIEVLSKP
ncbi:transcription antiterminator, partial [Bacillus velezensis]